MFFWGGGMLNYIQQYYQDYLVYLYLLKKAEERQSTANLEMRLNLNAVIKWPPVIHISLSIEELAVVLQEMGLIISEKDSETGQIGIPSNIEVLKFAQEHIDDITSRIILPSTSKTLLVELNYNFSYIGNDGAKIIAQMLYNKSLRHISLPKTYIGSEGAVYISEAISENHDVIYIDLSDNPIEDIGAIALAKRLYGNNQLRSLNLAHCRLREEGVVHIAKLIKSSNTLININLAGSMPGNQGKLAMIEALHCNYSLCSINLYSSLYGKFGYGIELVHAIGDHPNIKNMMFGDEHNNDILFEIVKMAQNRMNLHTIHLRRCAIELDLIQPRPTKSQAMVDVLKPLMSNSSILDIDFSSNKLGDHGISMVAELLKHNNSLRFLNLSANDCGVAGRIAIQQVLENRSSIICVNLNAASGNDRSLRDKDVFTNDIVLRNCSPMIAIIKARILLNIPDAEATFLSDGLITHHTIFPGFPGLQVHKYIIDLIGRFLGFKEIAKVLASGVHTLKYKLHSILTTPKEILLFKKQMQIMPIEDEQQKKTEKQIDEKIDRIRSMIIQGFADAHNIRLNVKELGLHLSYKTILLEVHPDVIKDDGTLMRQLNEIRYGSDNIVLRFCYGYQGFGAQDVTENLFDIGELYISLELYKNAFLYYNSIAMTTSTTDAKFKTVSQRITKCLTKLETELTYLKKRVKTYQNAGKVILETRISEYESILQSSSTVNKIQKADKDNKLHTKSNAHKTGHKKLYMSHVQYDNPLLNDEKLSTLVLITKTLYGKEGIKQLIVVGEDPITYLSFELARKELGDAEAIARFIDGSQSGEVRVTTQQDMSRGTNTEEDVAQQAITTLVKHDDAVIQEDFIQQKKMMTPTQYDEVSTHVDTNVPTGHQERIIVFNQGFIAPELFAQAQHYVNTGETFQTLEAAIHHDIVRISIVRMLNEDLIYENATESSQSCDSIEDFINNITPCLFSYGPNLLTYLTDASMILS